MPSSATESQPWKKHWPPQSEVKAGEKHGVPKGQHLSHDGSSGAASVYARDLDDEEQASTNFGSLCLF